MRITHVITRLIVGGAQENTIASVLGLQRRSGLTVQLVTGPSTGPEGSLEPVFNNSPASLTIIPELVRPVHPWNDWRALHRLTRLFRDTRPDIVHTHSGKAGVLGRLAAARAGVPVIVHTIHGPSFGNFQGTVSNWIFLKAECRAATVTSHFVSVAEAMTEQYLAAGIGRREQYTKIFSGFDLRPYLASTNDPAMRRRLGIDPNDVVVGKIARLFRLKGHDDLFAVATELVRRCPSIKFLLVGDGEWRLRFEHTARELGLEKNFRFTGLVRPEEIPALVGIMDLVVHLSRREGLPRALPQALAAGKPVVAYDCDGAKEVCLNDQTGFLLEPGDLTGLTNRVLQLAENPALREKLGARGRQIVQEEFDVERMIDRLHQLYLNLARARGIPTS